MREIEVKIQVKNIYAVKSRLIQAGCVLSEPVTQIDKIYIKSNLSEAKSGQAVLRLRKANDQVLLTLKKDITGELDCLEYEVVVNDLDQAEKILFTLGYKLWVEVRKERQKGDLPPFTVCLDKVENLGNFIELESLGNEGDGRETQNQMISFLRDIGITGEQITSGYDTLVSKRCL